MTPKRHTVVVKSSKTTNNNKTHHNTKVQFYDSCQNAIKSQFIDSSGKRPMQFRRRRKKMLVIDIGE